MIPHKTPDSDIFANELRRRIAACRKRLRVTRSARETTKWEEAPAAAKIESVANGPFTNYSAGSIPANLIAYSLAFEGTQALDSESLVLVGDQEVGIT